MGISSDTPGGMDYINSGERSDKGGEVDRLPWHLFLRAFMYLQDGMVWRDEWWWWLDGKLGLDRITFPGICPRFFASHGGQQYQLGFMCKRIDVVGMGNRISRSFWGIISVFIVLSSILQSCVNFCQYYSPTRGPSLSTSKVAIDGDGPGAGECT